MPLDLVVAQRPFERSSDQRHVSEGSEPEASHHSTAQSPREPRLLRYPFVDDSYVSGRCRITTTLRIVFPCELTETTAG